MMKFTRYPVFSVLLLSACAATAPIEMANPASMLCQQKGGKVIIMQGKNGQYGICQFPDGTQIEEWEFYRQHYQVTKANEQ
ncbi:DUF333 domain-containing protein [Advenella sp. WQ 585]|uniref:DUF333 domain-containing protein n=2 Tax=Advenella mandrilli TaxID=2800330 RepID=A0ABS1EFL2_9BURK|nr:DUF333 domain-containing protein [Advenella mandrilli]